MSAAVFIGSARLVAERARGERWVAGGVAAELALRLRASIALLRVLFVLAFLLEPGGTLIAYAAAALLLPRGRSRPPSWSGAVALGRFALLLAVLATISPGLHLDVAWRVGPAIWIPLGGVTLAGLFLLLASAPAAGATDERDCRRQVLGALPVLAVAAALIAGVALLPGLRWERIAAGAVIAVGLLAALGRAAVMPAAILAAVTVFFAGSGVGLQGGIGPLRVTPRRAGDVLVVHRAAGREVVDLRSLRPQSLALRASVGVGRLEILLPAGADVTTSLRVGRGEIQAGGREATGLDVRRSPASTGRGRHRFALTIVAAVGVGSLSVHREFIGPRGEL